MYLSVASSRTRAAMIYNESVLLQSSVYVSEHANLIIMYRKKLSPMDFFQQAHVGWLGWGTLQGVLMMQRWDVHHRDFSVQISPQKVQISQYTQFF